MTRRWPWLLAALAVCAAGLAVTWPALSRPGAGTLVVTAEDGLEVTVAGAGRVVRETGPFEADLPAGRYEVWTSWQGRPGPSVWVEVPAGGEAEARPPSAAPVRSPRRPFVVLARGDDPERSFATLDEAVADSRRGDTVEVHGNGPFVSPPLLVDRALTVRAGRGFRPILRLAPRRTGALLRAASALTLEGLELDARPAEGGPAEDRLVIRATGAALRLAHCRVRQAGQNNAVSGRPGTCHVLRCDLAGQEWSAFDCQPPDGGRVRLEGSLLLQAAVIHLRPGARDVAVEIRRCTFAPPLTALELRSWGAPPAGGRPPVRVEARDNVWTAGHVVVHFNVYRDDEALDDATASAERRRLVDWRERGNVYPAGQVLLGHSVKYRLLAADPEVRTLEQWKKAWGLRELDATQGEVRFAGRDVGRRTPADLDRLRPADFRLAPGSAGPGAGADVAEVGPGPPYERWRRTEAYREWRRQGGFEEGE